MHEEIPRELILLERNAGRSGVIDGLVRRLSKMVRRYGQDFTYDLAICIILYKKEKNKTMLYQTMSKSDKPEEIFLVTVIGCLSRFTATEAETLNMLSAFFQWVTRQFPRHDYDELKKQEREDVELFKAKTVTGVH